MVHNQIVRRPGPGMSARQMHEVNVIGSLELLALCVKSETIRAPADARLPARGPGVRLAFRSMGGFRSADELREVMDRTFELMSTDPEMGPRLRDARTPQRFEFPDLDQVVNITYAGEVEDGRHLRWVWSDDCDWEPAVEMTMDSGVANRYFQGKENIAIALARRRIKSSGNVKKALALIPITKAVFPRYRAMIEAEYPHLVE